ncbi:MAG: division/cell wall cluster transcriptional repressor MraZ [Eubacteriales bacterium]|nr:division/cell wall cluster transcriptional repressor MraZ [Clostridiales bacterium]
MTYFFGEYQQVIDSKNRIFIPAKFREILGEKAYIARNVDGCLSIYTEEGWRAYCDKILSLPSAEGSALARFIFPATLDAKIDSQGRIVLTQQMKEYAGLEKEICIIGVGDHAEIWDKARRQAYINNEKTEELIALMLRKQF